MPRWKAETIRQLKEKIDLRELAGEFTELRGGREQFGPCPKCGGTDRFHVSYDKFFCRNCLPPVSNGGRHDVLDFMIFVGRARNAIEAYELLSGSLTSSFSPVRTRPAITKPKITYENELWQLQARQEVTRCHTLLMAESGSLGQAYLHQRHLLPSTWESAQLGLTPRIDAERKKGWAISIPWLYNGAVTCIQYRFVDQRAQRYTRYQYAGHYGESIIFMLPPKGQRTLVICEGEINAMSVWQASAHDVVSVGSQNMTRNTLEALKSHVDRYQDIFVWFDEKQVAETLIQVLGGRGEAIVADVDANELLVQSRLQQMLA